MMLTHEEALRRARQAIGQCRLGAGTSSEETIAAAMERVRDETAEECARIALLGCDTIPRGGRAIAAEIRRAFAVRSSALR